MPPAKSNDQPKVMQRMAAMMRAALLEPLRAASLASSRINSVRELTIASKASIQVDGPCDASRPSGVGCELGSGMKGGKWAALG
jgi:hypothetical protein